MNQITEVEPQPRITLSFYKYFYIKDVQSFRENLDKILSPLQILGRVYLAQEGINAQISLPKRHLSIFRNRISTTDPQLDRLRFNISLDNDRQSFRFLRMKIRQRIVADGLDEDRLNLKKVGCYLKAEAVNTMANDPEVLFVDVRNYYEYEIGRFENAIVIPSNTFRQVLSMIVDYLQSFKEKKIILYCTGGIRCEKASALLIKSGFKKVFQVKGGIIGYTHRAIKKGLQIKFTGKNFVFDERLGEKVTSDIIANCHQCGTVCDSHTNCFNKQCHLLFIQCQNCAMIYSGCCSTVCQQALALPIR